jgi:hypothetical protein
MVLYEPLRAIIDFESKLIRVNRRIFENKQTNKLRGLVRQRIIPAERPPLVGKVSANFGG